jgi:hypothetical protein
MKTTMRSLRAIPTLLDLATVLGKEVFLEMMMAMWNDSYNEICLAMTMMWNANYNEVFLVMINDDVE